MTTYIQVNGQTVDASTVTVPANRKFRDAWTLSGDVVSIDVEKAKDIWKDKMRAARASRFMELDAQFFLALENSDDTKKAEITTKKQLLRNVTILPELLNATTVEEIEAVWPSYLNA